MLAYIFAYFGPFDTRSHKVANIVPNVAYFATRSEELTQVCLDFSK